jgi:hypothetical protein
MAWILVKFGVFKKLTRACYIQIALETMLLPILKVNILTNILALNALY